MYFSSARLVPGGTRCSPGNMAPGPVTGALIMGSGAVWVWANAAVAAANHANTSFGNMGANPPGRSGLCRYFLFRGGALPFLFDQPLELLHLLVVGAEVL